MRVLIALALLVVCAHAAVTVSDFEGWMTLHGKKYTSAAEKERRFNVFRQNAEFVEKHNREADLGVHTFRLGLNKMADLTNAEYRATYLNLRRSGRPSAAVSKPLRSTTSLPDSWDWRTKGAVNSVKDQGQCGSCWAFSATAAMETAWFLHSGKLLSLSEQLCVDCVNNGADNCQTGGEMHDCYLEIIKLGGDELETDYPYTAASAGKCLFDKNKAVTKFSSYMNITQYNETALAIGATQSVVSVAIDASSLWFQLYSSGVYNQADCKTKYDDLDHGVAVAGFGTLNGAAYWLVRNSWGGMWGQQGYILMSKDKNNQCGIATDATIPIV